MPLVPGCSVRGWEPGKRAVCRQLLGLLRLSLVPQRRFRQPNAAGWGHGDDLKA